MWGFKMGTCCQLVLKPPSSLTGAFTVFSKEKWVMFLTDSFFTVKLIGGQEIKTVIPVSCGFCLEH